MKPSLSLCMIVKNEEKFLEECLQSVQDVVSQVVIIDTGSTDRTLDIARKYQAEIHHFRWIDDFAAARNESIKYATGDWILWMDADERILEESKAALQEMLTDEEAPIAYTVGIKNIRDDGSNYFLSDADRLFRNHQGIRFDGRIHEQLAYSLARLKGTQRVSGLRLLHLGYNFSTVEAVCKHARNETLLLQMVEEEPNSAYAHYTLGVNYSMQERPGEALRHFRIALGLQQFLPDMAVALFNVMAESCIKVQLIDEAKQLALRSVSTISRQVSGYYLLFQIAEVEADVTAQIKWLREMQENNRAIREKGKVLSTDIEIQEQIVHGLLAKRFCENGQLATALEEVNRALHLEPRMIDALKIKTRILLDRQDYAAAAETMGQLLQEEQDPAHYVMLGDILIKLQQFALAIHVFELGREVAPGNVTLLKRLIGLKAKTGDMTAAEALMMELRESPSHRG